MTERHYEPLPPLRKPDDVMSWSQRLLVRLNAIVQTIERFFPGGRYSVVSPRVITPAQLAQIPPRGIERILIVSENGVSQLVFSDGTAWHIGSTDNEVT